MKKCSNLAKNLKVKFVGKVSNKEVVDFYNASDIVIVPSLEEPFGRVVIEAMACKKPVIGTNVGGIPEIIVDKQTGFLIPPKNPEYLEKSILTLIENKKLRRSMGKEGYKRVLNKFTVEKSFKKIETIFKKLYNDTLSK